jgi:hypothetical protein
MDRIDRKEKAMKHESDEAFHAAMISVFIS